MKKILLLLLLSALSSGTLLARPTDTSIESDEVEMIGSENANTFYFRGNVIVTNQDLVLLCNDLVATTNREGDPDATVGEVGVIDTIVATGNVMIRQGARVAYAGKAEVNPEEGSVTLSENPRIVDEKEKTEITGWKLVFNQHKENFTILPDPNDVEKKVRARVVLSADALPDLKGKSLFSGLNSKEDKTSSEESDEQ